MEGVQVKNKWSIEEIMNIHQLPMMELLYRASSVHREFHDPNKVQVSILLSIKTGGCPEDCAYCPQAARYHTKIEKNDLMTVEQVRQKAKRAKENGISRLCMGAAWRNVKDGAEFDRVLEMVRVVNRMDMEVCCTLGMITESQAKRLSEAGLYAYNHNIDSSESFYKQVISTRGYGDRLKTIENVRKTNITVCSGGIIGMGESLEDRIDMLKILSSLYPQPESVPINALVSVKGTPLEDQKQVSIFEMVRMIATARIVIPRTQVRLSAGRNDMTKEGQALCFFAGANSIFAGDKLLTTPNPKFTDDMSLFKELGLQTMDAFENHPQPVSVDANNSQYKSNGERPKWSRPNHELPRNKQYSIK